MEWREKEGVRWLEATMPGATAAFSTRLGGVSEGAFEALNVGLLTDDEPDAVYANRERLAAAVGRDPAGVLFGLQVHGAELATRGEAPNPNPYLTRVPQATEADGQITSNPQLTPLVQVADCLPVALAGERGVAMLHCGWRGLAAGIVERGVEKTGANAAAIGPGIGPCCYEVGDEVLDSFAQLGDGVADGRMLNLAEVARRLLDAAGVESVESAELCTSCNPELFFSHRRDNGRTGRQAGLVFANA
jgi:YfiH family protein